MSINTLKTYWASHKWARVITYTLATTTIICAIIGILINALLGPRQLTPLVKKIVDENVDAEVNIQSVEATFFSSFPNFRIRVKNAEVISSAFHTLPTDTIFSRRDTLLRVQTAYLGLNFNELLKGNIKLGYVALENPTIRIVTDVLGRQNYDIMKKDSTEVEEDTTSVSDYLSINHIRIKNARFAYIDVPNNKSFFANKVNLKLDGELSLNTLSADIEATDSTTTLRYDGTTFLNKLPIKLKGHVDCESYDKYKLADFHTSLGNIDLDVDGDVKVVEDSTLNTTPLDFNLTYKLSSPELSTVFNMIPKEYVSVPLNIETGSVKFDGSVIGIYTANNYPQFHTYLEIDSVAAKYQGMKEKIDDLSLKVKFSIDDIDPDSSYIHMNILHFLGGKSELTASADIDRLFSGPRLKARIDGHIDLKSLTNIFPVKGLEMDGLVDAKVGGSFKVSDIEKHNYGHVIVGGKIKSDNVSIKLALPGDTIMVTDSSLVVGASVENPVKMVSAPDTFDLRTDFDILFLGKDTIRTMGSVKRMSMTHPHIKLSVRDLTAKTMTYKSKKDTDEIAMAWADVKAARFRVRLDSIMIAGRHIHNVSNLKPSKSDSHIPYLENSLDADTLMTAIFGTRSMTRDLSLSMAFERVTDSTWHSDGYFKSKEIRTKTPAFALPILASNVNVTQKERTFDFKNISLKTGKSTINVSGQMHNLYYSLMAKQPFNATFNIKSDTLDINELMAAVILDEGKIDKSSAMDESSMDVRATNETIEIDSTQIQAMANQLVYISKRIKFSMKTEINTLLWSTLQLNKVKANIEILNRTMHLTNFAFNQGKGKVVSTLSYKPSRKRKNAQIDWFMRWERADVRELVQCAGLDTIMPMLEPLRGLIDCYMATQLTIDSTLTPDLNTARMSAHIGAHNATILDGETFAHISKLLMFKNKKENKIDTLSFNVLLDSGKIEVPPFTMSMDRYRMCIGGSQDLDMNMKYHVSILKSPLPFKAGVDIFGTPDKLDYDITTAKLKKYATDKIMAENDAKSLAVRLDILRHSYKLSGMPLPDQLKTQEEKDTEARAEAGMSALDKLEVKEEGTKADSTVADIAKRAVERIDSTVTNVISLKPHSAKETKTDSVSVKSE